MGKLFFREILGGLTLLTLSGPVIAISEEEHRSHHPDTYGEDKTSPAASSKSSSEGQKSPSGMGGMMKNMMAPGGMMDSMMKPGGMMDEMMRKMGAPKPRQLYPKMMEFPDLSEGEQHQIALRAGDRMMEGLQLLSNGVDQLLHATEAENYTAMQNSTAVIREGLGIFDSGLSAQRAVSEGKSPRLIALRWFKKELNITNPPYEPMNDDSRFFGWSIPHILTMLFLFGFFIVMIILYFRKMRRASQLVTQIVERGASSSTSPGVEEVKKRSKKFLGKLKLTKIFEETPQTKTFRLALPGGEDLPFSYRPGQFITLEVAPKGKSVRRSYSMSSSPTQRSFCEITVKKEDKGLVSSFLCDSLREEINLDVRGPAGKLVFDEREKEGVVLIAGGVGVTPVMSILRYLTDIGWNKEIYFFYSCQKSNLVIFKEELFRLNRRFSNLHLHITITREDSPAEGLFSGRLNMDTFARYDADLLGYETILCGSQNMMDGAISALTELGMPRSRIKTESFGKAKTNKDTPAVSPVSEEDTHTIQFLPDGKSIPISSSRTVLDIAEDQDIDIDSSCRDGSCGSCIIKLISGEVSMECDDGLDDDEKAAGMILACQAKPKTDLTVEIE